MFYVGNLEYLLFYSTCRCREKNKFGWIRPKLFKKYLIEQKYAKNWVSVLAVLAWSLYYGRTLRWDGWVAETTSLLRMRTGNCTEGSNPSLTANFTYVALIAQLDRALGYELRGREFESLWAHQLEQLTAYVAVFLCPKFSILFFIATTKLAVLHGVDSFSVPRCFVSSVEEQE